MDKLYIKVDENNIFEDHPHFASNVKQLYPDHDFTSGPPEGWVEFIRSEPPKLGPYQKFDETKGGNIALAFNHNGLEYRYEDGVYKDVWHVLEMSDAEKTAKQEEVKALWADAGFASWSFDEETCSFNPPVAYPSDGRAYDWNEETLSWELSNA